LHSHSAILYCHCADHIAFSQCNIALSLYRLYCILTVQYCIVTVQYCIVTVQTTLHSHSVDGIAFSCYNNVSTARLYVLCSQRMNCV